MTGIPGYQFVPYARHHKEAILMLLGAGEGRRKLWDWQFESRGSFDPVVVEDADGQVAGFNGYLPITARVAGHRIDGIWSCDFAVRKDCRGIGIGRAIKRRLQDRCNLILALGISDVAARVHSHAGWRAPHGVPQHILLLKARSAKERTKIALQRAVAMGASMPFAYRERGSLDVSVCSASQLPPETDQLWNLIEAEYSNVVVRSPDYLRWRFAEHPMVDYRLILVTRYGQLLGMGVFRCAEQRAALVDYVGPLHAPHVKAAIVDRFMHECATSDRLSCTTSDRELRLALRRRGFLSWNSRPLRFSVYSASVFSDSADGAWFLMGGDSDGDLLAGTAS